MRLVYFVLAIVAVLIICWALSSCSTPRRVDSVPDRCDANGCNVGKKPMPFNGGNF